ncbi:MAG: hypothetical protein IK078_07755 [Lachnospiraceae bacterium]|nr:hypothetical protein [Lachnospiraceae bacterium]
MQQKSLKTIEKAVLAVLVLLSVAATVSKLFVGFDIDEGYAIAMPFRLLMGDRLFSQMWEIHQTSSFLPALVMWPYLAIAESTDGIALYLRIISLLIHLAMSILVWYVLRAVVKDAVTGNGDENGTKRYSYLCIIAALVYFNLLPKWMQSVDFSLQQVWGLTLVLFFLWLEKRLHKNIISLLTGIALSMTVLGYVGMIVLYPVIVVLYILDGRRDGKLANANKIDGKATDGKSTGAQHPGALPRILWMTAGCACMALLFLAYVFVTGGLSVSEFLENIPRIFMDGTHTLGFADKLQLYLRQWSVVAKHSLIFAGSSFMFMLCLHAICVLKKKEVKAVWNLRTFTAMVMAVSSGLMVTAPILGIALGPFHFQSRFLLLFVLMWVIALRDRNDTKKEQKDAQESGKGSATKMPALFWTAMILQTAAFAGVLLFSNVGPDSSSSYLAIGLMAGLFVLIPQERGKEARPIINAFSQMAVVLLLLSLLMSKGFYVRYTEYFPADITQHRQQVEAGPLQGLYLLPEDAKTEALCREAVSKVTDDLKAADATKTGSSAMVLGTDQILNLSMAGRTVCPSTISTPAFNSQWILYFDVYPQLLPDVVFLEKNTIDDRDKFFAKNEFGQYLVKHYDVAGMQENEAICWVHRKDG